MLLNRKILYQAYQHIKKNPKEFDITSWGEVYSCRTVACLAGRITIIDGSGSYQDGELCNCGNDFDSSLVWKGLGLPNGHLFYKCRWPAHIQDLYCINLVEALRQAIIYFTKYDPEFAPETGDSLPLGRITLSIPLETA